MPSDPSQPASTQPPAAELSDEEVRHVAKLARLAIPDSEIHRYARQLQGILDYVAKVSRVDIEGVQPTAHAVQMRNVFREDDPGPVLSLEEVLQNAPDTDPPFFRVPKIIGGDEDSAG